MKNRRRFGFALAAFFAASGTFVGLLRWKSPTDLQLPSCPFRIATGFYCPGCGSTRAVRALLRGDFLESLRYNPITLPFLAVVFWLAIRFFVDLRQGRFPYRRGSATFSFFCAVFFMIYFFLRNVPLPAFDFLRPPATICR